MEFFVSTRQSALIPFSFCGEGRLSKQLKQTHIKFFCSQDIFETNVREIDAHVSTLRERQLRFGVLDFELKPQSLHFAEQRRPRLDQVREQLCPPFRQGVRLHLHRWMARTQQERQLR